MTSTIIIRVPKEKQSEFQIFWKELRVSETLAPEHDLSDVVETQNFDGASLAEWSIKIVPLLVPIFTGVLGYLIASRGEIEIENNGKTLRMKNMKPSQLKKIIGIIEESGK